MVFLCSANCYRNSRVHQRWCSGQTTVLWSGFEQWIWQSTLLIYEAAEFTGV